MSLSLSLSTTHWFTLSLSLSHSLILTLSLALTLSISLSLSLCPFRSLLPIINRHDGSLSHVAKDFVDGLQIMCGVGDPGLKDGMCIYTYMAEKAMTNR